MIKRNFKKYGTGTCLAQEYYKPRRWQRADCQGRSFVWGECSAVGYKSIAGHVVPDRMDERDGSAITNGRSIDAMAAELVDECLIVVGTHRGPASALHLYVENCY